MVSDHWSNDAMVSMDRCGLIEELIILCFDSDLYDIVGATLGTDNASAVVPFLLLVHPALNTNLCH